LQRCRQSSRRRAPCTFQQGVYPAVAGARSPAQPSAQERGPSHRATPICSLPRLEPTHRPSGVACTLVRLSPRLCGPLGTRWAHTCAGAAALGLASCGTQRHCELVRPKPFAARPTRQSPVHFPVLCSRLSACSSSSSRRSPCQAVRHGWARACPTACARLRRRTGSGPRRRSDRSQSAEPVAWDIYRRNPNAAAQRRGRRSNAAGSYAGAQLRWHSCAFASAAARVSTHAHPRARRCARAMRRSASGGAAWGPVWEQRGVIVRGLSRMSKREGATREGSQRERATRERG
jgi:hypothetical protein